MSLQQARREERGGSSMPLSRMWSANTRANARPTSFARDLSRVRGGKPGLAVEEDYGPYGGDSTPAPAPPVFPPNPPPPAPAPTPAPPPAPAAGPKLSKKTVKGPAAKDCGGYKWVIQWELDKVTSQGGWIVQELKFAYDLEDCSGSVLDPEKVGGVAKKWRRYWEAWKVNKNQKVTEYAEKGDVEDDTYAHPAIGDKTKRSIEQTGKAEFFDGLTLPKDFKPDPKSPAGILPVTTKDPGALPGGTGSLRHDLKATWDCCTATKTTKLSTT